MTDPTPPPPELEQFLAHAAELYALEKLASKTVVGPLRKQVHGVFRAAAALWVTMFGSLDAPATPERHGEFLAALKQKVAAIDPSVAGPLAEYADKALAMGVRHAADEVGVRVGKRGAEQPTAAQPIPEPRRPGHGARTDWPTVDVDAALDDATRGVLNAVERDVKQQLLHGEHAIDQVVGTDYKDATDALAETQRAVTTADRATTVVVNGAANTGSDAIAKVLGAARLWIAERNACEHCLAYSGEVAEVDRSFTVGLTFGTKALVPWPEPNYLLCPPLHPHCRCRTTPWLGSVPGYTGPDLPAVLKREAQRSILTGWRMDSESERARLDAAARLLRRGTNLPKSVQARARAAVKRGQFNQFPRAVR